MDQRNMFDLTGKIAVISGASSGLGADAARAYAQFGAKVALLARRKEKLENVAAEIRESGGTAFPVQCDASNEASVKAAIEEVVKEFGTIDILLNVAGVATRGGVDTLSEEEWDRVLNTNLKSDFLTSKYVIPHMKKKNYGKIVNFSSINGIKFDKPEDLAKHAYNASKAGVIGLTKGMAATYGRYNITVNAIAPALFESEMTGHGLFENESFMAHYSDICPMVRPGGRGELNGAIIFLSSDASSYVTGQLIVIDGGCSLV